MSFVNYQTKEINCKIVYYGPGLGGKTTNIQHIYQKTSVDNKSQMVTLNTDNERTLFFDFLPLGTNTTVSNLSNIESSAFLITLICS